MAQKPKKPVQHYKMRLIDPEGQPGEYEVHTPKGKKWLAFDPEHRVWHRQPEPGEKISPYNPYQLHLGYNKAEALAKLKEMHGEAKPEEAPKSAAQRYAEAMKAGDSEGAAKAATEAGKARDVKLAKIAASEKKADAALTAASDKAMEHSSKAHAAAKAGDLGQHAEAARAHRQAEAAHRAAGNRADADFHATRAKAHEAHAAGAGGDGKASRLKAFAEQAKGQQKMLQRGKKGGMFYISATGQKSYIGKGKVGA